MKYFLKVTLITMALIIGVLFLIGFLLGPEDACLDSGGCWDSIDNVCRSSESESIANELCARSKPR